MHKWNLFVPKNPGNLLTKMRFRKTAWIGKKMTMSIVTGDLPSSSVTGDSTSSFFRDWQCTSFSPQGLATYHPYSSSIGQCMLFFPHRLAMYDDLIVILHRLVMLDLHSSQTGNISSSFLTIRHNEGRDEDCAWKMASGRPGSDMHQEKHAGTQQLLSEAHSLHSLAADMSTPPDHWHQHWDHWPAHFIITVHNYNAASTMQIVMLVRDGITRQK